MQSKTKMDNKLEQAMQLETRLEREKERESDRQTETDGQTDSEHREIDSKQVKQKHQTTYSKQLKPFLNAHKS